MVTESAVDIAKKYISSLPAELDVRRAYIFGSFAKGTQREESDIDIAVVFGHMDDFSENNPVAAEIMNTGIEILNVA